jgi:uncharacterized Rossmann fold enzyme
MVVHEMPPPEIQEQAEHLFWNKLGGVTTTAATSTDESMDDVRANIGRGYPWFHDVCLIRDENKIPGRRIALVGGGPSLKNTVGELLDFTTVIVCGSAHDWMQEHSPRIPTYCAVCDPDPVMANYLRKPDKDTTYLISSHVNPVVYDALDGHNIIMWHCWPIGEGNEEAKDFLQEHTPGWVAIGGGCTVGLRSITIAMMMGYTDLHFFGFDSCMTMQDDHHAYPFIDPTKEFLGDVYDVKIGMGEINGPEMKAYRVAGYQLAQAEHYKQSLMAFGHLFKPTFHGPGLLADMQRMIDLETKRLTQEKAA